MAFALNHIRLFACAGVVLFVAGCGPRSTAPATVPVTGKVTLEGEPVASAIVSLAPTSDSAGSVPAQATTNESGEFEVSTIFDQGRTTQAGMTPGTYALTVTKLEQLPAQAHITRAPKNLLPKKYESTDSSELKATINADGDNFLALDLKN
ncbi:carboxypeptidase-like regulatory domain-containing protein [Lacipirellula parvula]|uniref:Carboxypeptidase regulatory-like domain-containing protein n=1 Tax=Lacipirellula parvula TaxID=2650471 RepID=A0A5K7XLL2_9BACT|nr:carboxypeptidase-like regulatory domain-containing protein [Lacipirellula parvula]BBO33829.1 hypothetical protein PLANPX_3441 [Lacipirellula parvula]